MCNSTMMTVRQPETSQQSLDSSVESVLLEWQAYLFIAGINGRPRWSRCWVVLVESVRRMFIVGAG